MGQTTEVLPADPEGIAKAAALIRGGALVAFPTETVYGLGGDATNEQAVTAIFVAKGRPAANPLIMHFAATKAAHVEAVFDARAEALAAAFWPGALTLVLRRRVNSAISARACAGLDTLAARVPSHPIARELLTQTGRPVAAPSANPSGRVSPTTATHVAEGLGGRIAAILDGGACTIGIESTVVDLSEDAARLLRPGAVSADEIEAVIGPLAEPDENTRRPRSPGLMGRHYAPNRPLRLNAVEVKPGEALLAFGHALPAGTAAATLNLSPRGDLGEAGANLFTMLRELDKPEYAAIAIAPVPETGLGRAINDRLRRAAEGG